MNTITVVSLLTMGLIIGSFLNAMIEIIPEGKKFTIATLYSKGTTFKYNLIGLFTVIIFLIVAYKFNFELSIQALFVALSFSMLLVITIIDIEYLAIPDSINLLAFNFAILSTGNILQLEFIEIGIGLKTALITVGGITLFRYFLSFFLNKEVLGEGNVLITHVTLIKNISIFPPLDKPY